MTSFDRREEAMEAVFAHGEELKFQALARRNRLLGLWAAGKLGKEGELAQVYASSIVAEDLTEPGDEDVLRKLQADFGAAGIAMRPEEIRAKMTELLAVAAQQVQSER
jgi:hypothetical protein